MNKSENIIRSLLESADIEVNGSDPWDIQVNDQRLYDRVLAHPALGMGEAYMDGWWDSESIDSMIDHIYRAKING